MSAEPSRKTHPSKWQQLRLWSRRCRLAVWVVLFLTVFACAYLNQIGLPDFMKRPLLASLQKRGVDLEFTRLRLRGHRGIVADNVRIVGSANAAAPVISAKSADLEISYASLLRFTADVRSVTLHDGALVWRFDTNHLPSSTMAITNLMATVRFLPGDQWMLDRLDAGYRDAKFSVTGQVTNASRLRDLFKGPKGPPDAATARLQRVHAQLCRVRFHEHPGFRLTFSGDAADPTSFVGVFTVVAPDAETPWGSFQQAKLTARLDAAVFVQGLSAEVDLDAAHVETRWACVDGLQLRFGGTRTTTNEIQCGGSLAATSVTGPWTAAQEVSVELKWTHGTNGWLPRLAEASIKAGAVSNRWLSADRLHLDVMQRPPIEPLAMNDPALGIWNHLSPCALTVSAAATNVSARGLQAEDLRIRADWEAPWLQVHDVSGHLAGGQAAATAALDVLSRRLQFDLAAALDFHRFEPLLTEKSRKWLRDFHWASPPSVDVQGELVLPAWTNRAPDWRNEVQPGIKLAGNVAVTNLSFRGVSMTSLGTPLNYTNRVWRLPDLIVRRPEGTVRANLRSDEISHNFSVNLRGRLDPRVLPIKFKGVGHHGLDHLQASNAPWLDAQLRGNWYELDRISVRADLAWTNFTYREQSVSALNATLVYSNHLLRVLNPRVEREDGIATAEALAFDFRAHRAYLTNGYSTTDPMAIARIIGPKTAEAVAPYQFLKPPEARVYGVIPLKGEQGADLHFEVLKGGPFHWMRFRVPEITGKVSWAHETVTLTNMAMSFYGGAANGFAWFDVRHRGSTPFCFLMNVTNADLHALMSDLHSPTNQLEGSLSGQLLVTNANANDLNSWQGRGQAQLRDGLIWNTPVFGVMSTVMNTVVPGIGNSRASAAGGTFIITNSVIQTGDLDIRASGMRLLYEGSVDFETRVNARVEAELLRDTWGVGRLLSTALWPVSKLFKYKVTGTLADPKPEPVYLVPRLVVAPLQSVEGMFGDKPGTDYEMLPDPLVPYALPEVMSAGPGATNAPALPPGPEDSGQPAEE